MRKSRVLLAGVAVAGAAVTTSAFTASNTVQSSVAGYGTASVTGATTAHINYVLDGTDKSLVDSIVFELNEDMDAAVTEGLTAWLQLENGGSAVGSPVQLHHRRLREQRHARHLRDPRHGDRDRSTASPSRWPSNPSAERGRVVDRPPCRRRSRVSTP